MVGTLRNLPFGGLPAPQVILEIGGNHEGDFAYATRLVELACQSKAQIVKLQIYSADGLVNPRFDASRHRHFQKFELPTDQYRTLLRQIRASGKKSCASVWSRELFTDLEEEIDVLKVGSGDFTNYLLVDEFLKSGKPVVLSTGLASLHEIRNALSRCKHIMGDDWASRVALLQCTTSYPCPPEHLNLSVISTFLAEFECPIGFSDHYEGSLASEVAFDIGARVFELHFTDSRDGKEFRDHKVSWTLDEVDRFIDRIHLVERMIGHPEKALTAFEAEQNYQHEFRKGLYYSRPLPKGHVLGAGDLVSLRPAASVAPDRYEEFVGRTVAGDVEALEAVRVEDFENLR